MTHQFTTTSSGAQTLVAPDRRTLSSAWQLAIAFAVISLIRLSGLTHQSLWYDEGYTLNLAGSRDFGGFLKTFFSMTTSEHLQPLYYFFIYFWSRLAGTSDLALRLPSALFSIASGLLVYQLSLHLPRVRRSFSVLACGAISVSSFSLYYAQEARPYALLQLLSFSLLTLWLLRRYHPSSLHSHRRALDVCFTVVCGLCVLGSTFTSLLVICLALADILTGRAILSWIRTWRRPMVFAAACFCSYLWLALRHLPRLVRGDVVSIKQPLWMNAGYTLFGTLFGTTLGPPNAVLHGVLKLEAALSFWPVLLPCVLVIVGLVVGVSRVLLADSGVAPELKTLSVAMTLYALVFFGFFGWAGRLNILPRHASALFPLLFVVVLLCASSLWQLGRPANNEWLTMGLAGWCALNLLSIYGYRMVPDFQKDDYRSTAQVLAQDNHVPVFMTAGQPSLLEHYGVRVVDATKVAPPSLSQFLKTNSAAAPRIELVVNDYRGYRWDHSAGPMEVLAPDYHCVQERHLAYMDLIACHLGGSESAAGVPLPSYAATDRPVITAERR